MSEVIEIKTGEIRQGDTAVLKNINVVIESHEFVYLIGKTGSGKSSLLKALYGELGLSSGTGFVAGFDLNKNSFKTFVRPLQIPYIVGYFYPDKSSLNE